MDISIIDFGGRFAGPALGFLAQGHRVAYFRCGPRHPQESLLARLGWEVDAPQIEADVVIMAASFADEAWAYEVGLQREAPLAPDDPFFHSVNPLQRRVRDRHLEKLLRKARLVVMVDMSDVADLLDPFFAGIGHAHFKRELPFYGLGGDVQSFPFIYHPGLLSMEWGVGLKNVELPADARRRRRELLFVGTIRHWRYFGRRRHMLEAFMRRHPQLPVRVVEEPLNILDAWKALQLCWGGLYMQGRGELCQRLHELSALAVPAIAAAELTIQVPDEWRRVLPTDPHDMVSPATMLDFYQKYYHPIRAAQWILDRLKAPRKAAEPPARPPPAGLVTPKNAHLDLGPADLDVPDEFEIVDDERDLSEEPARRRPERRNP
jgi:hypothetical protein